MPEYTFDLDSVLSLSLRAAETEGWSVEDCLARYPDHRHELEPALRIALSLRQAQTLRPSYTFRQNAQSRLRARLENSARPPMKVERAGRQAKRRGLRFAGVQLRPLGALAVAVLILTGSIGGVAYAADDAGPGDALYGVDLAVENLRLRFAASEEAAARLYLQFAEERLEEARSELDQDDADTALRAYEETLAALQKLLAGGTLTPEEEAIIQQAIEKLQAMRGDAGLDDGGGAETEGDEIEIESDAGTDNADGGDIGTDDNLGEDGQDDEPEVEDSAGEPDGGEDDQGEDDGDEPDGGEDDQDGDGGGDEPDGDGGEDDDSGSGGEGDDEPNEPNDGGDDQGEDGSDEPDDDGGDDGGLDDGDGDDDDSGSGGGDDDDSSGGDDGDKDKKKDEDKDKDNDDD